MGDLTVNTPKSMVKLLNGETVFVRQLRLLKECGITEVVVTTGPFQEQLENVAQMPFFSDMTFHFIHNDIYDQTNYIYSMFLARDYLKDDFISLHGDLVFNKNLLKKVIHSNEKNLITINREKKLPEKDFKGRINNGNLMEVSINIFDKDCYALQPMYKLSKENMRAWVKKVEEYIESGNDKVYAENAFNEILPQLEVKEFSYVDDYIDEIDTPEDLKRVSDEIRLFDFKEQPIHNSIHNIKDIIEKEQPQHILVVSMPFFNSSSLKEELDHIGIPYTLFQEFKPNPLYEDVLHGIEILREDNCDFIISFGGGSAIDTAKTIKLFEPLNKDDNEYKYSHIKHLCIPTTAGTGSESTRYAVIYKNGVKQSITHDSIVPDYAILDSSLLKTLPDNQKKSTMLDALCQGIESYWSVNSTDQSKEYSKKAIKLILDNMDLYIQNDDNSAQNIMQASNCAGKAINITQTTAAHAMSYKITSMYNIPHGYAVAMTLPYLMQYISDNLEKCIDSRGKEHLNNTLNEINSLFHLNSTEDTVNKLKDINRNLDVPILENITENDINQLASLVNVDRLKNTPVKMSADSVEKIYIEAFGGKSISNEKSLKVEK